MKKYIYRLLVICIVATYNLIVKADMRQQISLSGADELHCIYFDQRGLLWMGTSSGVRSYDGYSIRNEFTKEVSQFPQLLSDIMSLTSDDENHLWIGTNDGLLRVDLTTGKMRRFTFPKPSQQIIYKLFTSSKGTVYVGTDDGFSVYNSRKQSFRHFNFDNAKALYPHGSSGKYRGWGVKDFVETREGDILIGTWKQGLWRFSPKTGTIRAYERLNEMNSSFALCLDKANRLWIGTQGCGVQRLESIADYRLKSIQNIHRYDSHEVVYDILQLPDGSIYACTGDTIGAQIGPDGALWLALRQGGLVRVSENLQLFNNHSLGGVRSIYTDNGFQFLLGYGMNGLAWYDANSGQILKNNLIPGFEAIPAEWRVAKVSSIMRRYNHDVLAAAADNGIFVSHADGTSEIIFPNSRKRPYIKDIVTSLYEDPRTKCLWIGQRKGISILLANGQGIHLDVKNDSVDMTGYFMVNHIAADHKGNIWIASANRGILRISGNTYQVEKFRYRHIHAPFSNITACFEDSKYRMWAICSGGLLLYNEKKSAFEVVNQSFHLADRPIQSINEDQFGCIWITTDKALVRLDRKGNTISFTEQDGLESTSFFPNSTFRFGDTLFFGSNRGMVEFNPLASYKNYRNHRVNIAITDIILDGKSVYSLDSAHRKAITPNLPMATRQIAIPASARSFSIEFALLNYENPGETKYAYMLKGVDDKWQYTSGNSHCAFYSNLPAGNYTFILKAADSHGYGQQMPYHISVRVETPWWATWWAYLIYMCIVTAVVWVMWKYVKMQQDLEASRRFSSIVQSTHILATDITNHKSCGNADVQEQTPQRDFASSASILACAIEQRDAEFIAKATQLVNEHIDDAEYNRDRMAADFNMSVSTLYGRMRDCTGLSIQNFIQTIRLNAAAEILAHDPFIRINELAYRVGFNTPKYFSQCFKKKFGVLPGDYLKASAEANTSVESAPKQED